MSRLPEWRLLPSRTITLVSTALETQRAACPSLSLPASSKKEAASAPLHDAGKQGAELGCPALGEQGQRGPVSGGAGPTSAEMPCRGSGGPS